MFRHDVTMTFPSADMKHVGNLMTSFADLSYVSYCRVAVAVARSPIPLPRCVSLLPAACPVLDRCGQQLEYKNLQR